MDNSSSTERFLPVTSVNSGEGVEITPDLYCFTIQIVNVCFYGKAGRGADWVLIDAGMPKSATAIKGAAVERFGESNPPKAIILTHAHFDHIGAIIDLLEEWDVPVYAHQLELPYLTGEKDYPKPDGTVEGGLVAKMSPLFPNEGIDIRPHIQELPLDGSIPMMPGWEWIHTPGHSEGHVSLFRKQDGALIAGDAFVTVKQESLYRVFTQELEMNGPPRYLTTDWKAAKTSVEKLASLKPKMAITGHGIPAEGSWLTENLDMLAREFDKRAVPTHGKYVEEE
ncbi:MBL fold metallo-hydrolase [Sporosarcina sp. FSL K6-1508]|uniref:MBL fold metallo-hydrolase n=1 Tax=Sporosarcina sp. FSL K6-1508 TaxID=2921553 RepID=UPI0030FA1924